MNWSDLLRVLLSLLGPLLLKWLEDLLRRVPEALSGPAPANPAVAVRDFFEAARGRLWPWQFARRRALVAVERVALARAQEIAAAAVWSDPMPPLSPAERDAIKGA